MITINELVKNKTNLLIRRIQILFLIVSTLGTTLFTYFYYNSKAETTYSNLNHVLVHNFSIGDSLQIRRILTSLMKDGAFAKLEVIELSNKQVLVSLVNTSNRGIRIKNNFLIYVNGETKGLLEIEQYIGLTNPLFQLLIINLLFNLILYIISYRFNNLARTISTPIIDLSESIRLQKPNTNSTKIVEISILNSNYEKSRLLQEQNYSYKIREREIDTISNISRQVAHDIRSPLSALNAAADICTALPENHRLLIQNSVKRINDIADDLLEKGSRTSSPSADLHKIQSNHLITDTINEIVIEKNIQTTGNSKIDIRFAPRLSTNASCEIKPIDLKRILSNLINNSIEAVEHKHGIIEVNLSEDDNFIKILITDNGKGIPHNIIKNIGEKGFSFGKDNSQISGSGLGIYHAKSTLEAINGYITINSQIDHGTQITLGIPKAKP